MLQAPAFRITTTISGIRIRMFQLDFVGIIKNMEANPAISIMMIRAKNYLNTNKGHWYCNGKMTFSQQRLWKQKEIHLL